MLRLIICILIINFTIQINAQTSTWNDTLDLNIDIPEEEWIDMVANSDGIHLIHQSIGNRIEYYRFDTQGNQESTTTIDTTLSESRFLSKIIEINSDLYISYKKGANILATRSINGGSSWTNLTPINLSGSTPHIANGLDFIADQTGLHLVYSSSSSSSQQAVYYNRYTFFSNQWTTLNELVPQTDPFRVESFPSIALAGDTVIISVVKRSQLTPWAGGPGALLTKERYNNVWNVEAGIDSNAHSSHIIVHGSKLHGFFFKNEVTRLDLYHANRNLSGGAWSSSTLLLQFAEPNLSEADRAISLSDTLHITTGYEKYRYWTGTSWSSPFAFTDDLKTYWPSISTSGNDVYVVWTGPKATNIKTIGPNEPFTVRF